MVWQTNAQTIVMITNLKEGSRMKCTQYWPEEKGQSTEYGPFIVTMVEEKEYADFSIRTFELSVMRVSNFDQKYELFIDFNMNNFLSGEEQYAVSGQDQSVPLHLLA